MSSIFFVVKVVIITFLVILLLQVQVGEKSLEDHSQQFIVEASKKLKLNEVAVGLIQFIKEAQNSTEKLVVDFWQSGSKKTNPVSNH